MELVNTWVVYLYIHIYRDESGLLNIFLMFLKVKWEGFVELLIYIAHHSLHHSLIF